MKKTELKNKKGITLIALVITIIVMLILVAVTITVAVNGGLFDYAGEAARDTNTRIEEEKDYTNIPSGWGYENLIDKYTTKKIITFYINNTPYQAEEGMTWEAWVNDKNYSPDNAHIDLIYVQVNSLGVSTTPPGLNTCVAPSECIIENYYYSLAEYK